MYNYTNPKMQEVAKLCERGFWPICKNEDGEFAVFTPILNRRGQIVRSKSSSELENAKTDLTGTHHENEDFQPTEIVDFYHPPTPKFEVGDKVRVRENVIEALDMQLNNSIIAGKITEVGDIKKGVAEVRIEGVYYNLPFSAFEPVLETEPVIVEMTVAEIEEKLGVKNLKIVE